LPTELCWADPRVPAALGSVCEQRPLVHCLTNIVVAGYTANVLLAVGASPAMIENVEEAGAFAAMADAVLVNLGTLSAERELAMRLAAAAADESGRPWVLDPVGVGVLMHRREFAAQLLKLRPAVVRGNASEVMSLAGFGQGGRGVDSLASSEEARTAAGELARSCRCVVAVSGVVDRVTDGENAFDVPGGSPLMTRVTGLGCALGALIAAFAAVGDDVLFATAAASAVLAAAGERAAQGNPGPGTFAVLLVDELGALTREAIAGPR
jgi:hydroxyethylthiazole kinase